MKINLDEGIFQNVEIKCKVNNKENKEYTGDLINELSLAYDCAAKFTAMQGCSAIAKDFANKAHILYELLDKEGHYDKLK